MRRLTIVEGGPLGRPPRFRGVLSGRSGGGVGPWAFESRRGSANMGWQVDGSHRILQMLAKGQFAKGG